MTWISWSCRARYLRVARLGTVWARPERICQRQPGGVAWTRWSLLCALFDERAHAGVIQHARA